jgi:2-haloacid dehalogenase
MTRARRTAGVSRRQFVSAVAAAALPSMPVERASAQSLPPSLQGVRLLVFDTFGTVVDWRGSVIREGERLGRAKKLNVDWSAFADAWRGGYGPSMNRVRSGELPWTKLDVLHRMTLDGLLDRFKITGLTEAEIDHLNRVWHRLDPWPDAVSGLTRLRKRFVISPLSNGNVSLLTNMAKYAKLPWDCILSVELVRHYKPDRETYLMPGEFFDLEPAAVMMVAAHTGDLQSAQALGLKTAYVHRPHEYGPSRTPTPPPPGRFDIMAKDFRDLAGQLGT